MIHNRVEAVFVSRWVNRTCFNFWLFVVVFVVSLVVFAGHAAQSVVVRDLEW